MRASTATRGVIMLLQGLLSFRVVMALATSASVTAAVAGPMAYQATKARDEVVAAAPTTTTTTTVPTLDPPPRSVPNAVTSTTSTTTTTTTTTTIAGQPAPTTTTTTTTTIAGQPAPTTTTPPITATGLFSSVYSDHREPTPLDKSRAGARVWIFYDGPGVTSVTYWVDDPTGSGRPTRVAKGPFDLDPAGTDWRVQYGLGSHTVLAEVTTVDGTFRRLATFDVYR